MNFPDFYDQAPVVRTIDPFAAMLGAAADGVLDYHYVDAVRLAGHSCPTVAGAWLMARAAVRALYPDAVGERGAIAVTMSAPEDEGTTGVIAQVFTLVTGAAANNGFHGIAGRFVRDGLLAYGSGDSDSIASFRRVDTGATVDVAMDLSAVQPAPQMRVLMQRALAPDATAVERKTFADVWQERVRRLLLEHADDANTIRVTHRA